MTKIYAAFSSSRDSPEMKAMVALMLETCRAEVRQNSLSVLPSCAIALAGPSDSVSASSPHVNGGARVFLSRPCFDLEGIAERHGIRRSQSGRASQADRVAALISRRGPSVIGELNGIFSLVFSEKSSGRFLISNDRYGYFPLYYYTKGDLLLIASEVRAICAAVRGLTHDLGSWGDRFYATCLIGSRTQFVEVKSLGPGEFLSWEDGRTKRTCYWSFSRVVVRPEEEISVEEVNDRLRTAVERRLDRRRLDTLLLSPGFDSRLILGVLLEQGYRPSLLTVPFERNSDIVHRVSEARGLRCESRPERTGFDEFLDRIQVSSLVDGMRIDLLLRFPGLKVYPWLDAVMGNVWDGLALDAALGGRNQFEGTLRKSLPFYLREMPLYRSLLKKILHPDWFERMEEEFHLGLNEELDLIGDGEEGSLVFMLRNRSRKRAGFQANLLFTNKVNTLCPGTDPDLLDYLLSVPFSLRKNHRMYLRILEKFYSDLLSVPFLSAGRSFVYREGRRVSPEARQRQRLALPLLMKLGLGSWSKALYVRLRGERRKEMKYMSRVIRMKGLGRSMYQRKYLEKILGQADRGFFPCLVPLAAIFTIELWNMLLEDPLCSSPGPLRQNGLPPVS